MQHERPTSVRAENLVCSLRICHRTPRHCACQPLPTWGLASSSSSATTSLINNLAFLHKHKANMDTDTNMWATYLHHRGIAIPCTMLCQPFHIGRGARGSSHNPLHPPLPRSTQAPLVKTAMLKSNITRYPIMCAISTAKTYKIKAGISFWNKLNSLSTPFQIRVTSSTSSDSPTRGALPWGGSPDPVL